MTDRNKRQTAAANSDESEGRPAIRSDSTALLPQAAQFVREHGWKLLIISAAVLTPCFWHRRLEAGDLGSHLYNAWLVQLIKRGQIPGLWIAPRWDNVLFDYLLSGFARFFGLAAAEKIAVSLAVLIFFWGVFVLIGAATRRAPWLLIPVIAMVTYGWTFQTGLFNYYLSLGLSFWALAIFWRGSGWERLMAAALAPIILLAHPLGLLWLAGAAAYIEALRVLPRRLRFLPLAGAAAALVLTHFYIWHHYIVERFTDPFYMRSGADQLLLFGARYEIPVAALGIFVVAAFTLDAIYGWRKPGYRANYSLLLQLYGVAELGIFLFPDSLRSMQDPAGLALLIERLTLISAVLFCCLLGAVQPRRWHWIAATAIAAVFFSLVYQDTATVNKMEGEVERLVRALPPGQRVMATILPLPDSRVLIKHILDRACIGQCFSYGNYEPSSGQFRVHARPGNPYVLSDADLVEEMEEGSFTVRAEDLPVYQIYQCSAAGTDLCIRALEAGEDNDRLGVHPEE